MIVIGPTIDMMREPLSSILFFVSSCQYLIRLCKVTTGDVDVGWVLKMIVGCNLGNNWFESASIEWLFLSSNNDFCEAYF